MIGIKGMELPKSCRTMDGNERAEQSKCCPFEDYGFCWLDEKRLTFEFINDRHLNCPLVDLGKEDMSWEELVEKVKAIKDLKITFDPDGVFSFIINFFDDEIIIYFNRLNCVLIKNKRHSKTPYQMYQIIKALTGETE